MNARHRFQAFPQSGKMRGYQIGLTAGIRFAVCGLFGFNQEMGF